MISLTCKCGQTTMTFPHMNASDFPNGWETECCLEVGKSQALNEAEVNKVMEEVAEVLDNALNKQADEVISSNKELMQDLEKEPKKRGRKAKHG